MPLLYKSIHSYEELGDSYRSISYEGSYFDFYNYGLEMLRKKFREKGLNEDQVDIQVGIIVDNLFFENNQTNISNDNEINTKRL